MGDARRILPKTINIPSGIIAKSAPNKKEMYGQWYEIVIPIGRDEVAYLYLTDDAMSALTKIDPKVSIY